jgi:hypothetical protein
VTLPLEYTKISYVVGDSHIPEELLALHSHRDFESDINSYGRKPQAVSLEAVLDKFLFSPKGDKYREQKVSETIADANSIERILEYLQADLAFFEQVGISYSMNSGREGSITIQEERSEGSHASLRLPFLLCIGKKTIMEKIGDFVENVIYVPDESGQCMPDKVVFGFKGEWYSYTHGLFQRVYEYLAQQKRKLRNAYLG